MDGSLLPFDVALNDHTFAWTSLFTQSTSNWGNDLISGGNGDDILIGGAGADRISGDGGDDDLIGGDDGLALAGSRELRRRGRLQRRASTSAPVTSYGDVYGYRRFSTRDGAVRRRPQRLRHHGELHVRRLPGRRHRQRRHRR